MCFTHLVVRLNSYRLRVGCNQAESANGTVERGIEGRFWFGSPGWQVRVVRRGRAMGWEWGQLQLIRELADRGSVTAVAAATHRTPSAVSQQLKAIQRQAGVPLVE